MQAHLNRLARTVSSSFNLARGPPQHGADATSVHTQAFLSGQQ